MGVSDNGAILSSSSAPAPTTGTATIGAGTGSNEQAKAVVFSSNEDWDSERKLVTALSILQQMEAKVCGYFLPTHHKNIFARIFLCGIDCAS